MQPGDLFLRLFVSLNLFVLCFSGRLGADTELNIPGYRIEWHDEFEGPSVDPAKWDVNVGVNAWYQRASDGRFVEPHWFNEDFEPWLSAGTINGERQYYSPDNVTVDSGVLEIRSDFETVSDPVGLYDPGFHQYTSGKLNTADEFQFQFGIVRWRAQLPAGQGMWPALWMLNAPDPWFWDDEIDVMEARGSQPTVTTSAHHYKVDVGGGNLQNFYNSGDLNAGVNLQQGFHEYTLQWEPTFLQTWMDDREVFYDDMAIPQGPMFLIMNAAVGGFFDGAVSNNGIFPTYFKIDWVRVWQEASTPTDLASGGFEQFQGEQWANWNTRDDGNLAAYSTDPLHGTHSVEIGRRETANATGFLQTVMALPGTTVHYGVLVANHPSDPLGTGAHGRLKLEFLNENESPISEESTTIVDALSGAEPVPYSLSAVAPANTAFARLSIERVTDDPLADNGGSFLADAAFLQAVPDSELPLITSQPPAELTVNAGESVTLSVALSSPGPVAYQWYHNGEKAGTSQDFQFTATPGSGGRLFLVAANDAGPVISTQTQLTVLDPDSDGDGLSDYEEIFVTRTDPNDPLSVFKITAFAVDDAQLSLSFASVPGVTYALEASPNLLDWQSLGSPFSASESSHSLIQPLPAAPPRFFRIRVIP